MTIGAVFACAYRRDVARQTRNAVSKRAQAQQQNQQQLQTKSLSSVAAAPNKEEVDTISDEYLLGVEGRFGPWFLGPW